MNYPSRTLTIGKVAREAGVSVETIRYYQRRGLLDTPPKSLQGYRQYSDETVHTLGFIQMAKQLEFTLNEIKTLLTLRRSKATYCSDIRILAEQKIRELNEKSRKLERARTYLQGVLKECSGNDPARDCPIIEKLNKNPLLPGK